MQRAKIVKEIQENGRCIHDTSRHRDGCRLTAFQKRNSRILRTQVLIGSAVDVTYINALLYKPDGTTETVTIKRIATGCTR